MCGCDSCVDFADFAGDREGLLREFPSLETGLPSHDAFSGVFRFPDPEAFAACLGRFVEALGTGAQAAPGRKAASNGGEIARARALPETRTLDGVPVTGDALHRQSETARLVIERGGAGLFALKANRPAMRADVEAYCADPPAPPARHETIDADHGCVETRRHRVRHDVDWLFCDRRYPGEPAMPGPAAIARIERLRERRAGTSRKSHLLSVFGADLSRARRQGGLRPLAYRERLAPGPRHGLRRGPPRKPQGQRTRKPRHTAQARPQQAANRPTRHLNTTKAPAGRKLKRLPQNYHRPNAIALTPAAGRIAVGGGLH